MKLIGKILVYLIWAVNWVISLLLVFSCYGSLAAPMGQWPFASLSGLAFPFLFATNLLFLLFWLLLWRKGALLPLITLLVCIGPTLKYCPIHLLAPRRAADADLTVVSYNTESFGTRVNKEWSVKNPVLLHALGFEADIILIQETHANIVRAAKRDKDISADYPYIETESTTSGQTCMSKFPIIHAKTFTNPLFCILYCVLIIFLNVRVKFQRCKYRYFFNPPYFKASLFYQFNFGNNRIVVTIFIATINPCVQRSHVTTAKYVVNAIIEPILMIGDSRSYSGPGKGIIHKAVKQTMRE
jgi:hypothetical protein